MNWIILIGILIVICLLLSQRSGKSHLTNARTRDVPPMLPRIEPKQLMSTTRAQEPTGLSAEHTTAIHPDLPPRIRIKGPRHVEPTLDEIDWNEEFDRAYNLMESSSPCVFVTGNPGVGAHLET